MGSEIVWIANHQQKQSIPMDISKASTVICLTIIAVVALNVLIYFAFRRGIRVPEIDMIQKITDRSNPPWRKDQEDLDELAKMVENINQPLERDVDENDEQ
jgi:hypothetical protein